MQNIRYLTVLFIAAVAGCSSMPKNASLTEAHNSYNIARTNPEITRLAELELKRADDTLDKADAALKEGESDESVDHLAYLAKQQVSIAEETAQRKTAELAVDNAAGKRNEVRLEARTAEADASKRRANIAEDTANRQATELAVAGANTERDQALIAQQEIQLKELNAKKTERGMMITLGDVLFRTNKAQLEPGGMRRVDKLADFLNEYPEYKVLIEGHTDSTGSDSTNQELSGWRAYVVKTALTDRNVDGDRIKAHGYGAAYPVASNHKASGRQLNRRVEIILSDSHGNIQTR